MAEETLRDYYCDKNAMSIPFIESPFFYRTPANRIIATTEHIEHWELRRRFHEKGFIQIDLGLTEQEIDLIRDQVTAKIKEDSVKTQEEGYHYGDSPRVFEAWKDCSGVLELARHPKILSTLELLYEKKPIPFQTINFIKGSNQPLHSDTIHFHTIPHLWMTGVWVALDYMDENNGTLQYVPGSHKWPVYDFQDLNLPVPEYGDQFKNYAQYEQFLRQLVEAKGATIEILKCKPGTALIWAANLLHGGIPIVDKYRTRWSQAIHYYYEGCKHYYSPLFSNKYEGKWAEKDLSGKDILNHKI